MFTIDQIHSAHSKVKSGADFPNYVQDLIKLGVSNYETFVADGHTDYFDKNGHKISSEKKYTNLETAQKSDPEQFQKDLKAHQQGKTDYLTFCHDCAKSGVEKWTVDLNKMTCTYQGRDQKIMLVEKIPSA